MLTCEDSSRETGLAEIMKDTIGSVGVLTMLSMFLATDYQQLKLKQP